MSCCGRKAENGLRVTRAFCKSRVSIGSLVGRQACNGLLLVLVLCQNREIVEQKLLNVSTRSNHLSYDLR